LVSLGYGEQVGSLGIDPEAFACSDGVAVFLRHPFGGAVLAFRAGLAQFNGGLVPRRVEHHLVPALLLSSGKE